jgi:DNA-binding IclR family transcriptional regulator
MPDQSNQLIEWWILDLLEEYERESKTAGAIAVELGLPTAITHAALRRLLESGRVQMLGGAPERWSLAARTLTRADTLAAKPPNEKPRPRPTIRRND